MRVERSCFVSKSPLGGGVFLFEVVKMYVFDEPLSSSMVPFIFFKETYNLNLSS